MNSEFDHLDELEAESIHVFREVAAECERPILLYSIGKDSSVLLHLAKKAFYPGKIPFPLMHIDTGFKFPEMIDFRDKIENEAGIELIVYRNESAISNNTNPFQLGTQSCCSLLKTRALLDGLNKYGVTGAIGGARRDEEKSRAKERFFSFRDEFGGWNPKAQRPELWDLYNSKVKEGESMRIFPISNWTESDIWMYIMRENIEITPLYFAKKRKVIRKNHLLIPVCEPLGEHYDKNELEEVMCRFRTLGCVPCTGAVESNATTLEEVVDEVLEANVSERITRVIDHDSEGSMENKKREGYF